MTKPMVTAERLREVLQYDSETGAFTWRVLRRYKATAGSLAGTVGSRGYLQISIDNRLYLAHRLAWLYVHGEWPSATIDHINGTRVDNRLANLRDVSIAENIQNAYQPRPGKVSCQMRGATKDKRCKNWKSSITANGITYRLGQFATAAEAHQAYLAAKSRLHAGGMNGKG